MPRQALGLIETVGLAAAIEAADVALKSANVSLLGYELSKGGGMVTIKIEGDVGAVKAGVEAACAAAEKVTSVWSRQIIPRPHDELSKIVITKDTVGVTLATEKVESEVVAPETKEKQNVEEKELKATPKSKGTKKKDERSVVQQELTLEEPEKTETEGNLVEVEAVEAVETTEDTESLSKETTEETLEEASEDVLDEITSEGTNPNSQESEADNELEITQAETKVDEAAKAANEEPKLEEPKSEDEKSEEAKSEDEVCNLCKDPKCPRKKGDLRTTCIHYEEIKEVQ